MCFYGTGLFTSLTVASQSGGACISCCDWNGCGGSANLSGCTATYSPNPYTVGSTSGSLCPGGGVGVVNGAAAGLGVNSDVAAIAGSNPPNFAYSATRNYLEFTWVPSPNLAKACSQRPAKVMWGINERQDIIFDGVTTFSLPGYFANKFRVDAKQITTGMHTVRIDSISEIHYFGGSGYCTVHTIGWDTVQSSTLTFIYANGCSGVPSLSTGAPASGTTYAANTTTVPLSWYLTSSCPVSDVEYQNLELTNPGAGTPATIAIPVTGVATTQHFYNVGTSTYNCKTTAQTYSWDVKAKNKNAVTVATLPSSGTYAFTVAPNLIKVNSASGAAGCYPPTSTINLSISLADYNKLSDTFQFEFTPSNYTKDAVQSASFNPALYNNLCTGNVASPGAAIPQTVTCNIAVPASSLSVGTNTMYVKSRNTASECNGSFGSRLLNATTGTEFSYGNIVVGSPPGGTWSMSQVQNSDSSFRLNLSTPDTSIVQVQFYPSTNNLSGLQNCSTATYSSTPLGTPVTCTQPIPGGNKECTSAPFLPASAGRYCYKAVVTVGGGACGAIIASNFMADIYLVNTYIKRHIPSSNNCESGTPPDGSNIDNVNVDFSIPASGLNFKNTTISGKTTFGFWRDITNPPVAGEEVTVATTCANCVTPGLCQAVYVECGGDSASGTYLAGSSGVETYITDMALTGPAPTYTPLPASMYDIYMRMDVELSPDDWLTAIHGDVFAVGFNPNQCSQTSQDGTLFDGGLVERPEGSPYAKAPVLGGLRVPAHNAGTPYTGGYIFSDADVSGRAIESLDTAPTYYYLTEPSPEGRYAFHLDEFGLFRDTRFELLSSLISELNTNGMTDLGIVNGTLTPDVVYYTRTSGDIQDLVDAGGYTLNSNGAAVIYYLGSDPLTFDNTAGFVSKGSGTRGSLIVVTDQNVSVENNIGYSCWYNSTSGAYGCSSNGAETGGNDYSPSDTDFPGNIQATIISYGSIDIPDYDEVIVPESTIDNAKLLKVKGSLIALGEPATDAITFDRHLGDLSIKYPSETISYDENLLYNLTSMDRTSGNSDSRLLTSTAQIEYGY